MLLALLTGTVLSRARQAAYYDLLYGVVARHAIHGASGDVEKVDRLTQFVFRNVHPTDQPPLDEDGPPAETLEVGYGYCDQQVRLFMKLAQQVGLRTRERFLIDSVHGVSPHTVAEVWEDGRWGFVDVFYGYAAKRSDGSPATLDDFVRRDDPNIALSGQQRPSYEDSRVQLELRPHPALNALAGMLPAWLADGLQDAFLSWAPPSISIPEGSSFAGYSSPDGQLYWLARNHDLFGRDSLAIGEYRQLIRGSHDSAYLDEARFNLSLLMADAAPQASINVAQRLVAQSAPAGVRQDALLLEAQTRQRLGGPEQCDIAVDLYQRLALSSGGVAQPAALFQLQDVPRSSCAGSAPAPLASFGPLQLMSLQWDGQRVSLLWRASETMVRDYTVFVHALDARGQLIAQHDSQPNLGAQPTNGMRPGELVPDPHPLALPPDTAQIEVGLYWLPNGARLRMAGGGDAFRVDVVSPTGPLAAPAA